MKVVPVIHEVLNFWFFECSPEDWFKKDVDFDNALTKRFLKVHDQACIGDWREYKEEPYTLLSLIIVLDQFSRNIYRNDPRAFEQDLKALELTQYGIDKMFLQKYMPDEALFALLPLIHSEKIENHRLAHKLCSKFLINHPRYEKIKKSWSRHTEIITKFDRYPHRNFVLGRLNTKEEEIFLESFKSEW